MYSKSAIFHCLRPTKLGARPGYQKERRISTAGENKNRSVDRLPRAHANDGGLDCNDEMSKPTKDRRRSRQEEYTDCQDDCDVRKRDGNMLQMTAELIPSFSGRDDTYPATRWIDEHTKSAMFAADVTQDDGGASSDLLSNELQEYQHSKRAMFTTVNDEEDSAPSGHFSNDESKKAAFVYNDEIIMSKSMLTKEKKPVVLLEIKNVQLKALVDTGSDVNIISADVYDAIGKPKCEKDELLLSGIGQSTVRSMGKCRLNLCVDKHCYPDVTFHVLCKDYIPYDVIIGQEFLNDVTVVLKRGCVKFYSKEWERLGCYVSEMDESLIMDGAEQDLLTKIPLGPEFTLPDLAITLPGPEFCPTGKQNC
ncbi:hypothetical protein HW555_000504 [Spodoptera exigua]|uniref:Peptidase A2 domain-containing protein n=1 Tax=Spodoptera exigua TaxID=7107 RepID=A0A835GTS7_SPOEX|nr:hypothetical protein HW555_000504 [Spodoptera exigua]